MQYLRWEIVSLILLVAGWITVTPFLFILSGLYQDFRGNHKTGGYSIFPGPGIPTILLVISLPLYAKDTLAKNIALVILILDLLILLPLLFFISWKQFLPRLTRKSK